MSARLQTEISDLRDRYGVKVNQLNADELEELVDACRLCDNPFSDIDRELLDGPADTIRGMDFYPLTVGASVWLDEYAERWWGRNSNRYFWALVYAATHARCPAAFANLTDEGKAHRAIIALAIRFTFSRARLEKAMDLCLGVKSKYDGEAKTTGEKESWCKIVSLLESNSGIDRTEWLWGRSAHYTMRAYTEMHSFASAYSGGDRRIRAYDELDRALTRLAKIKKHIKERLDNE